MTVNTHMVLTDEKHFKLIEEEKIYEGKKEVLSTINSANFLYFNECIEKKIIDENGRWIEPHTFPLPSLKRIHLNHLRKILDRKIFLGEKDISLIPEYKMQYVKQHIHIIQSFCLHNNVKIPFSIREGAIKIELSGNLFELFKFLLTNNRNLIESIVIYGGAVPKILGKMYYEYCLEIINRRFSVSKCADLLNNFNLKINDYDFRIFVPKATDELLKKLENEMNLYFVSEYLNLPNFNHVIHSFIYILNETIYTKKARIIRQEDNFSDDYLLKSFGKGDKEIDISFIRELSQKELFSSNGLYLELIPYINKTSHKLTPMGSLALGWQSIIDEVCKTITVTNPNHPYYEGWIKLVIFLTKGYWLPDAQLHRSFVKEILNKQDVGLIAKSLIKNLFRHNKNNKKLALLGVINAAIKLRSFISEEKILIFLKSSLDELIFSKNDEWYFYFKQIIKNEKATFSELLDLMNFLIVMVSQSYQLDHYEYTDNQKRIFCATAISTYGYLHFPIGMKICDYSRLKILYSKNIDIEKFIYHLCSNLIYKKNEIFPKNSLVFNHDIEEMNPFISFWLASRTDDLSFLPLIILKGLKLLKRKESCLVYIINRVFKEFNFKFLEKDLKKHSTILITEYLRSLLRSDEQKNYLYAMQIYLYKINAPSYEDYCLILTRKLDRVYLISLFKNIAIQKNQMTLLNWHSLKEALMKITIAEINFEEYQDLLYIINNFFLKTDFYLNEFFHTAPDIFDNYFIQSQNFIPSQESVTLLLKIIKQIPMNQNLQKIAFQLLKNVPSNVALNIFLEKELRDLLGLIPAALYEEFLFDLVDHYLKNQGDPLIFLRKFSLFNENTKNIIREAIHQKIKLKRINNEKIDQELFFFKQVNEILLLKKYKIKQSLDYVKQKEFFSASHEIISLLNFVDDSKILEKLILKFFDSLESKGIPLLNKKIEHIIKHKNFPLDKEKRKEIYLKLLEFSYKDCDLYFDKILEDIDEGDTKLINEIYGLLIDKINQHFIKKLDSNFIVLLNTKIPLIFFSFYEHKKFKKLMILFETLNIASLKYLMSHEIASFFINSVLNVLENTEFVINHKTLIINNLFFILKEKIFDKKDFSLIMSCCTAMIPHCHGILLKRMLLILDLACLSKDVEKNDLQSLSNNLFNHIIEKKEFAYLLDSYHMSLKVIKTENFKITKRLLESTDINLMDYQLIFEILKLCYDPCHQEKLYWNIFYNFLENDSLKKINLNEWLLFLTKIGIRKSNVWLKFLTKIQNSNHSFNCTDLYEWLVRDQLEGEIDDIFECWKIVINLFQKDISFFSILLLKSTDISKNSIMIKFLENNLNYKNLFFESLEKFLKKNKLSDENILALDALKFYYLKTKYNDEIENVILNYSLSTQSKQVFYIAGNILYEKENVNHDLYFNYIVRIPEFEKATILEDLLINILDKYFEKMNNNYSYCYEICQKFQNVSTYSYLIVLCRYLDCLINMHEETKPPQFIKPLLKSIISNLEIVFVFPLLSKSKIQFLYSQNDMSDFWFLMLKQCYLEVFHNKLSPMTALYITYENLKYLVHNDHKLIEILKSFIDMILTFKENKEFIITLKENFLKIDDLIFLQKFSQSIPLEKKNQIWEKNSIEDIDQKKISSYKNLYFSILTLFITKILEDEIPKKLYADILIFLDFAFAKLIDSYIKESNKIITLLEKYLWYSTKCKSEFYFDQIQDHCIYLYEKMIQIKSFQINDQNLKCILAIRKNNTDLINPLIFSKFVKSLFLEVEKHKNPYSILTSFIYVTYLFNKTNQVKYDEVIKIYESLFNLIDFCPYLDVNIIDRIATNNIKLKDVKVEKNLEREDKESIFDYFQKKNVFSNRNFPIYEKKSFLYCLMGLILDNFDNYNFPPEYSEKVITLLIQSLVRMDEKYPINDEFNFTKYNIPSLLCDLLKKSMILKLYLSDHTSYFMALYSIRKTIFKSRDYYKKEFSNVIDLFDDLHFTEITLDPIRNTFLQISRINLIQDYLNFLLKEKRKEDIERSKKIFKRALELDLYAEQPNLKQKYLNNLRECLKSEALVS